MTASVLRGSVILGSSRAQSSLVPVASVVRTPSKAILPGSSVGGKTSVSRRTAIKATSDREVKVDFDKVLADLGDKFEASDNKAAIVAYSAAAVFALWFSEWLIHLPALNFILGFPIQLLGLVLLPYLGVKYFVEKDGSITDDAGRAVKKVTKQLPGLDK